MLQAVRPPLVGHQIDSSKIDGNVEFVHSQYSCILSSQLTSVNSVFASDKIINNRDHFRIKCLSHSKISAILCVLFFVFTLLFYLEKLVN